MLVGKVVDQYGNPVSNVDVHYIFTISGNTNNKFDNSVKPFLKIEKTCPSTIINFTIPEKAKVTLKILRWYTRELIATLVDDTLNSGTYAVNTSSVKMTNGLYILQLAIDTMTIEKVMVVVDLDVSTLIQTTPLTRSNSKGFFELPYELLGIGIPIVSSGVDGNSDTMWVSNTIEVILYKQGYDVTSQSVSICPNIGMQATFILRKQ